MWSRGAEFLGCKYSILGGAMTWLSERRLVSSISNTGCFGVIACGSMSPELLAAEIKGTKTLTDSPFGVNLIIMHPDIEKLIDTCLSHYVSHVFLAGGIPKSSLIKRLKEGGAKVICFAPSIVIANRLAKIGVDALVIEGSEAGGHIGPVSTNVLAQEILPEVLSVPVFVAGGISRGESIVNYLDMGASGVQLGTRFVCSYDSIAHHNFKKAFIKAHARDAVVTTQLDKRFPVIPVRALKNSGTQEFLEIQKKVIDKFDRGEIDLKSGQLEIEHYWAGSLKRGAIDGDIEYGSLMAGQSVGMVNKEQSTQEIVDELLDQVYSVINRRANVFR